ncbi:hypothetical protein Sjap_005701 [Stephania japonica]|uniref:RNase H type-1 domain-containing protein n=1 Tax=Stephania japonica TaxID=461633 RepID=A0AAP0K4K2_9MAGN
MLDLLCGDFWCIWRRRNQRICNQNTPPLQVNWDTISLWLQEYQSYRSNVGDLSPPQQLIQRDSVQSKWTPLAAGKLKLNIDASVIPKLYFVGIGGVIRDHLGVVHRALANKVAGCFSPEVAELLAIREGFNMANQLQICVDEVVGDATSSVALEQEPQPGSYLGDM